MYYKINSDDKIIDWNATGNDRIIQNVLNIIRTKKFEVPFMRQMGTDPDHIDSPSYHSQTDIINDVKENIESHEPRVQVMDVSVIGNDVNGDVIIQVELEV